MEEDLGLIVGKGHWKLVHSLDEGALVKSACPGRVILHQLLLEVDLLSLAAEGKVAHDGL